MNDNILVSLIVAVYNGEKYIASCIDSIMNQTYKNYEVILVDDGSKDSSGTICDHYAEKDSRIKVIDYYNNRRYQHRLFIQTPMQAHVSAMNRAA